jgi:hypothetical protein
MELYFTVSRKDSRVRILKSKNVSSLPGVIKLVKYHAIDTIKEGPKERLWIKCQPFTEKRSEIYQRVH